MLGAKKEHKLLGILCKRCIGIYPISASILKLLEGRTQAYISYYFAPGINKFVIHNIVMRY